MVPILVDGLDDDTVLQLSHTHTRQRVPVAAGTYRPTRFYFAQVM